MSFRKPGRNSFVGEIQSLLDPTCSLLRMVIWSHISFGVINTLSNLKNKKRTKLNSFIKAAFTAYLVVDGFFSTF